MGRALKIPGLLRDVSTSGSVPVAQRWVWLTAISKWQARFSHFGLSSTLQFWVQGWIQKTGKLSRIAHSSMKFVSGTIKIWAKDLLLKYRTEKSNGMAAGAHNPSLLLYNLGMYGWTDWYFFQLQTQKIQIEYFVFTGMAGIKENKYEICFMLFFFFFFWLIIPHIFVLKASAWYYSKAKFLTPF